MSTATKTATWPDKNQTARILGCSVKTVETLATRGILTAVKIPHAGKNSPSVVYDPETVEREAILRGRVPALAGLDEPKEPAGDSEAVPLVFRTYLNLRQAARLSGLPRAYLEQLIAKGKLPAVKHRAWLIRRSELEAL
jgi:excisionase family DNA binding protein